MNVQHRLGRFFSLGLALATSATLLTSLPGKAGAAPNSPETYTRFNLALGGNYYAGNLNLVQANIQGHLAISSPTAGIDILTNGYRLWDKPDDKDSYEVAGDDLFLTVYPFWYFSKRFFLTGIGRYETSTPKKLDHRLVGGLGIGYAPVRSKDWLIRVSVVPAFEYSTFPGQNFRTDVDHDGSTRSVIRAAVLSNGWYRVKDSRIRFGYFAWLWPSATDPKDFRLNLTPKMDVKIIDPVSIRLSLLWTYDPGILEGREPYDIRSTFGIVFTN